MKKTMYCYSCEAERDFRRDTQEKAYEVRGETITLSLPVWICGECGEAMVDEAFGDPVEAAFSAYREKHKLLGPEQIKRIREQWGLSQDALAKLLGMSPATINRYEAGSLQERTHDELIRSCNDRTNMVDLLDRRGDDLGPTQLRRVREAVEAGGQMPGGVRSSSAAAADATVITGFRRFDLERYAAMVVWLAGNARCVTMTKLNKLLFYADFWHYLSEANSISGSPYRRMHYGPVPAEALSLQQVLEDRQIIELAEALYQNGNQGVEICPGPAANSLAVEFTATELSVLREVQRRLGELTPSEISDLSHDEPAWIETPNRELISYEWAQRLRHRIDAV